MNVLNKLTTVTIVITIFLFAAGTCYASTYNDLITVPTAGIMTKNTAVSGEMSGSKKRLEIVVAASGMEIGGDVSVLDSGLQPGVIAKLPLTGGEDDLPSLALGVKSRDVYLMASKELSYSTAVHIGVGGGNQLDGLLLGVNKVVNPYSIRTGEHGDPPRTHIPINLMAEYVRGDLNVGCQLNMQGDIYFKFSLLNFKKAQAGITFAF